MIDFVQSELMQRPRSQSQPSRPISSSSSTESPLLVEENQIQPIDSIFASIITTEEINNSGSLSEPAPVKTPSLRLEKIGTPGSVRRSASLNQPSRKPIKKVRRKSSSELNPDEQLIANE